MAVQFFAHPLERNLAGPSHHFLHLKLPAEGLPGPRLRAGAQNREMVLLAKSARFQCRQRSQGDWQRLPTDMKTYPAQPYGARTIKASPPARPIRRPGF